MGVASAVSGDGPKFTTTRRRQAPLMASGVELGWNRWLEPHKSQESMAKEEKWQKRHRRGSR